MGQNLNIPSKTLDDNFKLFHFQEDFLTLLNMTLSTLAKPKRIDFKVNNEMTVVYDNGNIVQFRFEKLGKNITKIINLTESKETNIEW